MAQRYERECNALAEIAKNQLNLPKNRTKSNFEDMPLNLILCKIEEEIEELFDECYDFKLQGKTFEDCKRIFEELGDATACLVGLLSHINHSINEGLK